MSEDVIGKSLDRKTVPSGMAVDPKSGEARNYVFQEVDKDQNMVFARSNEAAPIMASVPIWKELDQFEDEYDDLVVFSEIDSTNGFEAYAREHGPLFGAYYEREGITKEPIEMWEFARQLMAHAMNLKAARDTGRWRELQDKTVAFECDIVLDVAQKKRVQANKEFTVKHNQPLVVWATTRTVLPPEEYVQLTLNQTDEYAAGAWVSRKWDDPGIEYKAWIPRPQPQIGMFDTTEKDRAETLLEVSTASIDAAIFLNHEAQGIVPPDPSMFARVPLECLPSIADEVGPKLCNLLCETLISMHTRHVNFDWIGHEYRPLFTERIRYMWYLFAIYKDKAALSFCKHCGKPFIKHKADRLYCSDACKRAKAKKKAKETSS